MNVLPFPAPSGPYDRDTPESRAYAAEIRAWRERVLREVAGPPRAVAMFRGMLKTDWSDPERAWAAATPYNVRPFPAGECSALAAMAWRATFQDLLSDIWDGGGMTIDECNWILEWLRPGPGRCPFCMLAGLPSPQPDMHGCILIPEVRAKWPKSPFD